MWKEISVRQFGAILSSKINLVPEPTFLETTAAGVKYYTEDNVKVVSVLYDRFQQNFSARYFEWVEEENNND